MSTIIGTLVSHWRTMRWVSLIASENKYECHFSCNSFICDNNTGKFLTVRSQKLNLSVRGSRASNKQQDLYYLNFVFHKRKLDTRKNSVGGIKSEMVGVVFELFVRWKIVPLKIFQCLLFISLRSNNTKAFLLSSNLVSVNILNKIKLFTYHKFVSKLFIYFSI